MLRSSLPTLLKHRPKSVKVDPGCNRLLDPPVEEIAKSMFAVPEYPNKKVLHNWRFFIKAGKAATGPPVGQEFSKMGLKTMDFTKGFNDRTKPVFKDDIDVIVRIQVFFDKSFNYRIEPPPTAWFILKACRIKRRETGPVNSKGQYSGLVTLEMLYEIARMKQWDWGNPEYPPIETRVRSIAGQCRQMGIAVIGVDCPSSPVKGMTPKQYADECAKYREIHMQQYEELKQKELEERASHLDRLHTPNLDKLPYEKLEEGLVDAKMLAALWTATHPKSPHGPTDTDAQLARRALVHRKWMHKDMHLDEARAMFSNWHLPTLERKAQLDGISKGYWSRDDPAN